MRAAPRRIEAEDGARVRVCPPVPRADRIAREPRDSVRAAGARVDERALEHGRDEAQLTALRAHVVAVGGEHDSGTDTDARHPRRASCSQVDAQRLRSADRDAGHRRLPARENPRPFGLRSRLGPADLDARHPRRRTVRPQHRDVRV